MPLKSPARDCLGLTKAELNVFLKAHQQACRLIKNRPEVMTREQGAEIDKLCNIRNGLAAVLTAETGIRPPG